MKINFTKKQLNILQNSGLSFDLDEDISEEQLLEMDEKVADYFAYHGINGDEVNEIGVVCESILDIISEM